MTNIYEVKIVRITEVGEQPPAEPIAEGLEFSLNNERFFAQCGGENVKDWGEVGKDIYVKVRLGFVYFESFGLSKIFEKIKKIESRKGYDADKVQIMKKIPDPDPKYETIVVKYGSADLEIRKVKKDLMKVGDFVKTYDVFGKQWTDNYFIQGQIIQKFPSKESKYENTLVDVGKITVELSGVEKNKFEVGDYIKTSGILCVYLLEDKKEAKKK
ncbi:MAG TPA: hypothetical protein HA254_04920 [Candidatus Diapherotrites archaeon]|uniref:Uncharacterized protein n=1 Tax=Candidatus Iainarchaeum sp. TaxID=3101447 RepID=A0A7J4IWT5_9ARCH|nr:hypothetical protein [Candidatus Diapherotrites archaeon]